VELLFIQWCLVCTIKQQLRQGNQNTITRMGKANAVFGRLERIWKSNRCIIDTKVRLYESIVLSTLIYGAEIWPITVANGRRLEAAHHRWLRRILHVSWRDKIPNETIRERTRQEELGCIIRRLGHVARMNKNRRAKQVMNWTPGRKGEGEDRGKIGRRPSAKTMQGLGLTWEDALDAEEDRDGWRKRIARCAVQQGKD